MGNGESKKENPISWPKCTHILCARKYEFRGLNKAYNWGKYLPPVLHLKYNNTFLHIMSCCWVLLDFTLTTKYFSYRKMYPINDGKCPDYLRVELLIQFLSPPPHTHKYKSVLLDLTFFNAHGSQIPGVSVPQELKATNPQNQGLEDTKGVRCCTECSFIFCHTTPIKIVISIYIIRSCKIWGTSTL